MRFLIRCEITSQDDQLSYPVPFCTAEVEFVSAESDGKCELKLDAVRWLNETHTGNELDRELYREKSRKLRRGSGDISPTATLDESDEMTALTPAEWAKLAELLDKTEIHERK